MKLYKEFRPAPGNRGLSGCFRLQIRYEYRAIQEASVMAAEKQEKSQADKFREAAKEIETDDDEERFDERLKKIAGKSGKQNGKNSH
ncbi:MAG: hypothetical protein R3D32_13265 [Nitratireductor sp.]